MNLRKHNRMCDRWLVIWLLACGSAIGITADEPLQFFGYVGLFVLSMYSASLAAFLLLVLLPDIINWLKGN